MKLKDVLNNRNCEGKIYRSDVDLWLGAKMGNKDREELINKLQEVADESEGLDTGAGKAE